MFDKSEKNCVLNWVLTIITLVVIITGVFIHLKPSFTMNFVQNFETIHIWIGYVMIALVLSHVVMNFKAMKEQTKKMLKDKKKVAIFAVAIIISIGLSFLVLLVAPQKDEGFRGPNGMNGPNMQNDFQMEMPQGMNDYPSIN